MLPPRWVGFRLQAEGHLAEPLSRLLDCVGSRVSGQRWFYLWHAEGGLHLRMRFRVKDADQQGEIAAMIAQCIFDLGVRASAREEPYLRSVYGFGETKESVLAELLHEATSALALQLLSNVRRTTEGQLWVAAACAVWILVRAAIPKHELDDYFDESLSFARRVAHIEPAGALIESDRQYLAVRQSLARFETALVDLPLAKRSSTIVRRLWSRERFGRFVAVHGLHLFCNELGMTIQREHAIYSVLRALYQRTCDGSVPAAQSGG